MVKELVSPRQAAKALGVSESSVKRWCDEGKILSIRTAGGHRRLPINSVLEFLRKSGYVIVDPDVLGLPTAATGKNDCKIERERERLFQALVDGREDICTEIILNLYLSKYPMSTICDQVLTEVFHQVGDRWECGDVSVYQERRSCELCHRVIHELRRIMPELTPQAPIAIGGTLDGDPYTLATAMSELVLRDSGWRANSLGNMLPFQTLRHAVCDMQPKLLWISVSSIRDMEAFVEEFGKLSEMAHDAGIALVVGGRALTPDIRKQMNYDCFCDTFAHLERFAKKITQAADKEV